MAACSGGQDGSLCAGTGRDGAGALRAFGAGFAVGLAAGRGAAFLAPACALPCWL
ncbi:hypothetical protein [Sphingomonas zeae]|nr:hypothetical protein [Sphingomonas zeae]